MQKLWAVAAAVTAASLSIAAAQAPRANQQEFRALYKELVETNTTLSAGSCTLAAERMAARLKAVGYADGDLTLFSVPEKPKEGGLVAVLPGADPKAKAILLLAHVDVVEAKREDWKRDPFTLVEENGYFFARGASDDKAQAAIYTDAMIRLKKEPKLRRTVKLALTCGEETSGAFNGADWLARNKRDLIDAEFALNEGGGGRRAINGGPGLYLSLQVAEKVYQDFIVETHNAGGHSSQPRPDNAITQLSAALVRLGAYTFPVHITPTTKAFFSRTSDLNTIAPDLAKAMSAIAVNPNDTAAEAVLARDPAYNSTMRTTCVATQLEGGHAQNALPQSARANVNCRIIPGETIDAVRQALVAAIGDPGVTVTAKAARGPIGKPGEIKPEILGPAERLAKEMYPGLPIIPSMSTGATDSTYLAAVGIPSYGVPGILGEADGGGTHGLDERIRVDSVYTGRDYLYRLIKLYASAK